MGRDRLGLLSHDALQIVLGVFRAAGINLIGLMGIYDIVVLELGGSFPKHKDVSDATVLSME